MSIQKLSTKFANGTFINNIKEFFNKINEIIDKLNNTTSSNYKVYRGLISQSSTNHPTALILENTLGLTPDWIRDSDGSYRLNLGNNIIPDLNKVFVMINNNYGEGYSFAAYADSGAANRISIATFNNLNIPSDNLLSNTSLEIIIYE